MNKTELVNEVADAADVTKAAAGRMIDVLTSIITSALKRGDAIILPGFGSFSTTNRSPRMGRNPQTGQPIQIKASRVAKFKAGKKLKEEVQRG